MRFSIARLLIATVLVNVVLCLSYAAPVWIGFPALSFLSLIVIPPMIIVGVVNTRGARQAFFLGCMLSGIAHWVTSLYFVVVVGVSSFDGSAFLEFFDGDEWGILRSFHAIGYLVGVLGGLSGVGMYFFVTESASSATEAAEAAKTIEEKSNHPEEPRTEWEETPSPTATDLAAHRPASPK